MPGPVPRTIINRYLARVQSGSECPFALNRLDAISLFVPWIGSLCPFVYNDLMSITEKVSPALRASSGTLCHVSAFPQPLVLRLVVFCLVVLLSFTVTSVFAKEEPALRLTPMARATPPQLKLLGRDPTPFERYWGIFVQWRDVPDGIFQLSVPEFIATLLDGSIKFVCGHEWQADGAHGLKMDVPLQFVRGKKDQPFRPGEPYVIDPYRPYAARLRAWVRPHEDHVEIRIQLENQSKQELDPQVIWVCFLQGWGGPEFDQITVPGLSRESYFRRDEKFLPWRDQIQKFNFMGAGGSALTKAGWCQIDHFNKRDGKAATVRPHPAVEGVRAAIIDRIGERRIVALTSDHAAILGGKNLNPCTDLGLEIHSLPPATSQQVWATAWFLRGGLDVLSKKLSERSPRDSEVKKTVSGFR